jgi:hypothetical protein
MPGKYFIIRKVGERKSEGQGCCGEQQLPVSKDSNSNRIKEEEMTKDIIKHHQNIQMRIILVALFAGIIAAAPQGLKKTLGQRNVKNLAEVPAHIDLTADASASCDVSLGNLDLPTLDVECPCQFTELPGLGAGISQGYKQHAEAS